MAWILESIQIGKRREHSDAHRIWETGIFKTPVDGAIEARKLGLSGDQVGDTKHHGGSDKAICCHPWQHHLYWNAYFGWDLQPGAFGENFTISGLTETHVAVGDIWQIGETQVQVSQPRIPCWKQDDKLGYKGFNKLVSQTGKTGFYLRVLQTGMLSAGSEIHLIERPYPQATIVQLNRALQERDNHELHAAFHDLAPLSQDWRDMFAAWLDKSTA